MSGPIIRKYGFPNHERIFGQKPIEHGADEEETASAGGEPAAAPNTDDHPRRGTDKRASETDNTRAE